MKQPPLALEHMRPIDIFVWALLGLGVWVVLAAIAFGIYEVVEVVE